MSEKKEWVTPELVVVCRGNDNENVLAGCATIWTGCAEGQAATPNPPSN